MNYNSKHIDFSLFEEVLKVKRPDGRVKHLGCSNVDMAVDLGNNFLFVDWLDDEARNEPWKNEGKLIYAKKLTNLSPYITYLLVTGDVETQSPEHFTVVRNGLLNLRSDDRSKVVWQPCTKEKLVQLVKNWVDEQS
ncbi:hypothetical protein [Phyllobacterium sophorae]|uniref:Uncharacterized protein n=1 Tax=Phyllobacterium sophorae TaxID=1520277 RepID=A0A2P7BDX7_9HYPH|nr:hypothetical protein [Phyllobacterium sophorae]PSH64684.1 hypothetical protein CU103_12435 [Phyllobacterium sophorae]